MAEEKKKPILTLSVCALLLNLHPRTLMLYEKEGLIQPYRTSTNRRLFSQVDLGQIQFIQYLIDKKRANIAGAKVILDLLEKAKERYPNLKEDFFPDFETKELI
jgi:MerR family transcriptional regulator/heat shock protein HspR